jgi:hypothetical protein
MYPEHVAGAYSDRGRDDVLAPLSRFGSGRADGSRQYVWGSDVDAFADAIDSRGFKREEAQRNTPDPGGNDGCGDAVP